MDFDISNILENPNGNESRVNFCVHESKKLVKMQALKELKDSLLLDNV
jgi:hypothetical protein